MNFMLQNKTRGIRFDSRGNAVPVALVDASNKPDPTDSKCQYGISALWQSGPIITVSRKLAHVGLSAAHNEYMAIHWAVRHIVWLREMLIEVGLAEIVEDPTVIFGDNRAANGLCEQNMVTQGNQFIRTSYHYVKEAIRSGDVRVCWIDTGDNVADLMTKAVARQVYEQLAPRLLGYVYGQ